MKKLLIIILSGLMLGSGLSGCTSNRKLTGKQYIQKVQKKRNYHKAMKRNKIFKGKGGKRGS